MPHILYCAFTPHCLTRFMQSPRLGRQGNDSGGRRPLSFAVLIILGRIIFVHSQGACAQDIWFVNEFTSDLPSLSDSVHHIDYFPCTFFFLALWLPAIWLGHVMFFSCTICVGFCAALYYVFMYCAVVKTCSHRHTVQSRMHAHLIGPVRGSGVRPRRLRPRWHCSAGCTGLWVDPTDMPCPDTSGQPSGWVHDVGSP